MHNPALLTCSACALAAGVLSRWCRLAVRASSTTAPSSAAPPALSRLLQRMAWQASRAKLCQQAVDCKPKPTLVNWCNSPALGTRQRLARIHDPLYPIISEILLLGEIGQSGAAAREREDLPLLLLAAPCVRCQRAAARTRAGSRRSSVPCCSRRCSSACTCASISR